MRISDWSSDVCSSDLVVFEQPEHFVELALRKPGTSLRLCPALPRQPGGTSAQRHAQRRNLANGATCLAQFQAFVESEFAVPGDMFGHVPGIGPAHGQGQTVAPGRSEERRVGKEGVAPCRSRWSPYH